MLIFKFRLTVRKEGANQGKKFHVICLINKKKIILIIYYHLKKCASGNCNFFEWVNEGSNNGKMIKI